MFLNWIKRVLNLFIEGIGFIVTIYIIVFMSMLLFIYDTIKAIFGRNSK